MFINLFLAKNHTNPYKILVFIFKMAEDDTSAQEERYYVIREKGNPQSQGLTVRLAQGKLENLTGDDSSLKKYMAAINSSGNLVIQDNCIAKGITIDEARKNVRDYSSSGITSMESSVSAYIFDGFKMIGDGVLL